MIFLKYKILLERETNYVTDSFGGGTGKRTSA